MLYGPGSTVDEIFQPAGCEALTDFETVLLGKDILRQAMKTRENHVLEL